MPIVPNATAHSSYHLESNVSTTDKTPKHWRRGRLSRWRTHDVNVPSVARFTAKVKKLGGHIYRPRTAVPQMGQDTENSTFAIWEMNAKAK